MPVPFALCIEDRTGGAARYTRCVALVGRQPGLHFDARGEIRWQDGEAKAVELWVSGDDRLMAYRLPDAPPVRLQRGGRSFDLPAERPVVLLTGDDLDIGERQLRIHIHGPAPSVQAPAPLPERSWGSGGKVAAVVALGAAVVGCLDVRENPPDPVPTSTGLGGGGTGGAGGAGGAAGGAGGAGGSEGGGLAGGGGAAGSGGSTGGAGGGG